MVTRVSRGRSGRALAAALVLAASLAAAGTPDAGAAKRTARADLSVRSATATLESGRVTVTLVAVNGGRRPAAASSALVTWKPVGSPVVTVLRRFRLPAIRARARRTAKVVMPVPSRSSGAHVVSVCLNVRAAIRETRRANNCRDAGRVSAPSAGALGEVRTSAPVTSGPAPSAPANPPGPGAVAPPAGGDAGPDVTPPDTTIGRGPAGTTTGRPETFMFAASEAGATFECRLDAGDWAACVSPAALTALADGPHTFEIRATDAAGNTDAFPASRSWTVDGTAPETLITAGPPPQTGSTSASLEFSASEAEASFECRLDGGAWTFCSSSHEVTGLAAGPHRLQVRAIDAAGNRDATPAARAWTVDLTAPQTTIGSGPPDGETTGPGVAFGFSSETGATFECRLDAGAWAACSSPAAYAGLADGAHTFEVRARDAAGNPDPSPAQRTWTVDATAPQTTIDTGPSGTVVSPDATFEVSASEAGATFTCRLDGGAWAPCTSPVTLTGLADGEHTYEAAATDGFGNTDVTPATQTWTVAGIPVP